MASAAYGPMALQWQLGQPRRFRSMLSSSAQRQLSEFVYPFATNSDRGGLTDVKSIALPQLYNADSAAAVEVEAKRSTMRPYPTGGRGWEMSGDNHDRPIGEGLEETSPCRACPLRVDAKAAVELGFGNCSGVCMMSPLRTNSFNTCLRS